MPKHIIIELLKTNDKQTITTTTTTTKIESSQRVLEHKLRGY